MPDTAARNGGSGPSVFAILMGVWKYGRIAAYNKPCETWIDLE